MELQEAEERPEAAKAPTETMVSILLRDALAAALTVIGDKDAARFLREFASNLRHSADHGELRGIRSAVKDREEAEHARQALQWFKENAPHILDKKRRA